MPKHIVKRGKPSDNINKSAGKTESDPALEALLGSIEAMRAEDPLIGAKIGGREVFQRALHAMEDERGVHAESLLCALGALAGYACQAGLRAQAVEKKLSEEAPFDVVTAGDGAKYYFGDPLNQCLYEGRPSVWSIAAGAAKEAGCGQLPDMGGVFERVAASVGDASFGIPRLPDGHPVSDKPINYLKALWGPMLEAARIFCPNPSEWPVLFALAVREAIQASRDTLDPGLALAIVMEAAIPMSKVDLPATGE